MCFLCVLLLLLLHFRVNPVVLSLYLCVYAFQQTWKVWYPGKNGSIQEIVVSGKNGSIHGSIGKWAMELLSGCRLCRFSYLWVYSCQQIHTERPTVIWL